MRNSDPEQIRKIAASTGFFDDGDVCLNHQLAQAVLLEEDKSHEFLVAEFDGEVVAYVCFGSLADARKGAYEIFWISTDNKYRGCGIGHKLVNTLLELLKQRQAYKLYLKTDSTEQYTPTRNFYERLGFVKEAILKEYYNDADDCCIYSLKLNQHPMMLENEFRAAE